MSEADRLGRGCTAAGDRGSCRDPAANGNELNVLPLALTVRSNSEMVSAGKAESSQPTRSAWCDRFRVFLIEILRARAPNRAGVRSERTPRR